MLLSGGNFVLLDVVVNGEDIQSYTVGDGTNDLMQLVLDEIIRLHQVLVYPIIFIFTIWPLTE